MVPAAQVITMSAQHKRKGKAAKLERQRRAKERDEQQKREQELLAARRAKIVVHFPRRWDPERNSDDVSPGQCVAWADGRGI